eukprot:TRINITY_DN831_c1_g1_i1.p1 TRINITY_DN831_c1_g1~~TRINITY_DN831_c1_g1_i1.p1  ORF type:complete len:511 (+),score=134.83 TRINITY_DN831_c1_g1_i1:133-1665(+)
MLHIPPELLVELLHYVGHSDLATCGLVNRAWARLILGHYQALWGGRLVTIKCANAAPSGRTCHSAVQHRNKMYTIGGMPHSATISCVKKELCILDLKEWKWRVVSKCIPAVTEQTTVMYGDSIFLFGGYYEVEGRKSHLFKISCLDDPTPAVEQLCIDDEHKPPARSSHTALVYEHRMYVFGGWERVVPKNDLFALDLQTLTWRMVHDNDMSITEDRPAGPGIEHRPCPRRAHTAFVIGHEMMVFGGTTRVNGEDVECRTASIDVLDMNTETWELRRVCGDVPCPRSRADGAVYEGVFYLAGGWNRSRHLGDFHCFSPVGNVWRKLEVAAPFGIVQHSTVVWQGRLLMFGGYKHPNLPPRPAAVGARKPHDDMHVDPNADAASTSSNDSFSSSSSSSSSSSLSSPSPPLAAAAAAPPAPLNPAAVLTPGPAAFPAPPPSVTSLALTPLSPGLQPPAATTGHGPESSHGYTTNDVHLYHLRGAVLHPPHHRAPRGTAHPTPSSPSHIQTNT